MAEKKKEKREPEKYERREFLKRAAIVSAGTALYGAAGYGVGRIYKAGQDSYREDIKPLVDKTKEAYNKADEVIDTTINKTKEAGQKFWDFWTKNFNKDKYETKIKRRDENERIRREEELGKQRLAEEAEKMSRRKFFNKYLHLFNKNPVATGTATGVTAGLISKGGGGYFKYKKDKKNARIKDEHIEYGNKIKNLEEDVDKLKTAYEKLNINKKDSSDLEEEIEKDERNNPIIMLLSGIVLILGFIVINGIAYTGFSVLSKDSITPFNFLGIIIIFTSSILIIVGGIRLNWIRKIEKRREKTKNIKPRKKN